MNVVIRTDSPEVAPRLADPLDHLADVLFHNMGTDGVYAPRRLHRYVVVSGRARLGSEHPPAPKR